MADKKRDPDFTKLVVNLQRALETVASSIRLLMKDIIKPFWVRVGVLVHFHQLL